MKRQLRERLLETWFIEMVDIEQCPVCGQRERVTMAKNWQQQVEAGRVIEIVQCGNPFHYTNMDGEAK